MNGKSQAGSRQGGFSLLEMMVVLLILGIVSAGLFVQIDNAQQRAFSEQVKLDNFQEARDFVDQFFRDINEIGYPNTDGGYDKPFLDPGIDHADHLYVGQYLYQ